MGKKKKRNKRKRRGSAAPPQIPVEQMPYDLLWKVASLCVGLGVIMHILVYSSGLYFDEINPALQKPQRWRFGFWSSTYWALGYSTAIPFGIGCVFSIHFLLNRIGFKRRSHKLACILGCIFAGWIVYGDYDRVMHHPAEDWIQWNHYYEFQDAGTLTNSVRTLTFFYSYTVYFIYYSCFIGSVFSILWFSIKPPKRFFQKDDQISDDLVTIGRFFRWCILILIAYFALVRCCKIEMYFRVFPPEEGSTVISPFEFYKQVEAYPERISASFYFDLCLLLVWTTICVLLHLRIAQFRISENEWKKLRMLEPTLFKETIVCLGKPFLLMIGILTFGVIFPPPDRASLIQITGAITVAYLIKLGLEKDKA